MKLPPKINSFLEKIGIRDFELLAGTRKEWILGTLILLSPLLILAGIIIWIAIMYWPIVWDKIW